MNNTKFVRTKATQIAAAILIFLSFFTWQTEPAQAISCGPINAEMMQSGLGEFEAVFIGEVIAADERNSDASQDRFAHYRVDRVFKGAVPESFSMKASEWGDPFVGETYIMFIDSLENPSFDSPEFAADCRNTLVEQIEFDYMALLGEGYAPAENDGSAGGSTDGSTGGDSAERGTNTSRFLQVAGIVAISLIGTMLGLRFMGKNRSAHKCDSCGATDLIEVGREIVETDTVELPGGGHGGGGDIRLRMKEEVTYRCNSCGETTTQVVMKTN